MGLHILIEFLEKNDLLHEIFFMPPTLKKLRHIGFSLSMRASIRPSVGHTSHTVKNS